MKKTKRVPVCVFLFLIFTFPLSADPRVELNKNPEGVFGLTFFASSAAERQEEIVDYARQGLKSLTIFEIRVFRESAGWRSRYNLVRQFEIFQEGSWDPFDRVFLINSFRGEQAYFREEDYFSALFCLKDFPIELEEFEAGAYQIRVRAKFQKIVFSPPLNILSPFASLRWLGLPWTIYDFEIP